MKQSLLIPVFQSIYTEEDGGHFNAKRDITVQAEVAEDVDPTEYGDEEILKYEQNHNSFNNAPTIVSNAITAKNEDAFVNFITANSPTNDTLATVPTTTLESVIGNAGINYPDAITSMKSKTKQRNALLATAVARSLLEDSELLSLSFAENGKIPSKAEFTDFINTSERSKTRMVIEGLAKQLKPIDSIALVAAAKAGIDGILNKVYSAGRISTTENVDGMDEYNSVGLEDNAQQTTYNNLFKMAVIMFSNLTPGFIKSSVIKILPTSNIPSKTVTVVYSNAFGKVGERVAQILTGINRMGKHNEIASYFRDNTSQQLTYKMTIPSGGAGGTTGQASQELKETPIFKDSYIGDLFDTGKYRSIPPVSIKIIGMSTTHRFKKTVAGVPEYEATPIVDGVLLSSGSLTSVQNTGSNAVESEDIMLTHTGVTPVVLAPPQYAVTEQSGFVFDKGDKAKGRKASWKLVTFTITFNQNTTNFSVFELPDKDGKTYIKDVTVEFIPEPGYNNRKEDKTITSYVTTSSQSFTVNEYVESKVETPAKLQANYAESTSGDNIIEKQRTLNSGITANVIEKAAYDKIIGQCDMFDPLYGDKNIHTETFDLSNVNRLSPGDRTTDIDIPKKLQEMFKEGIRQAILKLTAPFYGITTKGIFIVCNPLTLQAMNLEGLTKYNDYKLSSESDVLKMDIGGTSVAFVTSTLTKAFTEESTAIDEHTMYAHIVLGDLSSLSTVYGKSYEISSANGYVGRTGVPFLRNINEYDFISRFPTSLKIKVKGFIKTANPNPADMSIRAGGSAFRNMS